MTEKIPPYPHMWFCNKFTGIEFSIQPNGKIEVIEYWDKDIQKWKSLTVCHLIDKEKK